MSDAMGPLTFGKKEEQIFLGREIAQHQDYSEDTAIRIDQEVKRFVHGQLRARARPCSSSNRRALERSPRSCSSREVLDAEQVRRIVAGEALEEHKPRAARRGADDGSTPRREGAAVDRAAAAAAQQADAAGIDAQSVSRSRFSGTWSTSANSPDVH